MCVDSRDLLNKIKFKNIFVAYEYSLCDVNDLISEFCDTHCSQCHSAVCMSLTVCQITNCPFLFQIGGRTITKINTQHATMYTIFCYIYVTIYIYYEIVLRGYKKKF